jgi:hypothetical protein
MRLMLAFWVPSTTPLVPPGIHHQKEEDKEAKNEKNNGARFVLPKQVEILQKLRQIHY